MVLHQKYLPFSVEQLKSHFAAVKQNDQCEKISEKHIDYYQKSIKKYEDYLLDNPYQKNYAISQVRGPCQIEKDERFWTTSYLMNIFHDKDRGGQFIELLQKGSSLPMTLAHNLHKE